MKRNVVGPQQGERVLSGFLLRARVVTILGLAGAWALAAQAADPHDPVTELNSFRIAEGYEVNLFASEADGVVKPIQIRFDPAGKLWVCGSTVYPQLVPGEKADDKIVVLEDQDGDGRADKSTVFARGLFIPTGLEWGDGGLYVGQATELLHLQDRDGDGQADTRRVLLSGFGTGDAHQTINSFTWGPAGELMMCQGLHALSRVETPWGPEHLNSAGVWRLRPRTLRLDPLLQQEMGPQNPFGVAFDRWGQPFLLGGNGQGIYYLTPALIRAEHHLTLRALWNTGRKFGGADFVENSHFPPEAQGQLVTGSYLNNAVYRFRVEELGAGFKVEELPPLITSTNTAFRIVDARFGPDGALYLCDWYNPVIGHYQASFRHPDRDKAHGRIWRLTARGRPLVSRPQLTKLATPALLEELNSPQRWNRQMAKRILADRPGAEVTNALAAWTPAAGESGLFEALGVYESLGVVEPALLGRLLRATNQHVRAYATRTLGQWHSSVENPLELLQRQAQDPDPRVRLEAVVAASYIPEARSVEVATSVVAQPVDSFIEYALIQAIHTLKPYWRAAFLKNQLTLARPAQLEFLVATDGSADTLGVIVARLQAGGLTLEMKRAFLHILAETGGASEIGLLFDPALFTEQERYDRTAQAAALEDLAQVAPLRKVRPTDAVLGQFTALLEDQVPGLRAATARLAGIWKLSGQRSRLEKMSLDSSEDAQVRRAAIAAMATLGGAGSEEALFTLAVSSEPALVRGAAVKALSGLNLNRAAEAAARLLAEVEEQAVLEETYGALIARRNGGATLAQALQARRPSRRAAEIGLGLAGASGRRTPELATVLMEAAGLNAAPATLTSNEIAGLVAEVNAKGNVRQGEEVYRRAELSCSSCHAINGQGGEIGPDLGALGTAQTVDFIIGAVLSPNKEVKEGFVSVEVLTKDGTEYQGYQVRENADELVIRDLLQKREVRLRRDAIREVRTHGSVMPVGLTDSLTRTDFRDLIAYLAQLGRNK